MIQWYSCKSSQMLNIKIHPDTVWEEEWCPFLFRLLPINFVRKPSLDNVCRFSLIKLDIMWWWSKQSAWKCFCKVLDRPDQQVRNYSAAASSYISWPPPSFPNLCSMLRGRFLSLLFFLTLGLHRSFFYKISRPIVLIYITCEKISTD